MDQNDQNFLLQQFQALQKTLAGLYEPTPNQGLTDRPMRSIHVEKKRLTVPFEGALALRPVWTSSALDTHGYTSQNAFVAVGVRNVVLADQNVLWLRGVLEGSYNSAFVEMAASIFVYTGNGDYPIPLLATVQSFATAIRFRFEMWTDAENLTADLYIDGTLVAGPLV